MLQKSWSHNSKKSHLPYQLSIEIKTLSAIVNSTMRHSAKKHSPSPGPTRNLFFNDMLILHDVDDSPFDEPPVSGIKFNHFTKYTLDGYSFYQPTTQTQNGHVIEYNSRFISKTLSQKIDPRTSSQCDISLRTDNNGDSTACESRNEYSSLISTHQNEDNGSVNKLKKIKRCGLVQCHVCGEAIESLRTCFGFSMSNFRSKPLPKPIVWKDYTCLKGTYLDSAGTSSCRDNCIDVSLCKTKLSEMPGVQNPPCHKASNSDSTSFTGVIQDTKESLVRPVQAYLESFKVSADPESKTSNNAVEDCESTAYGTISSEFSMSTKNTGLMGCFSVT